MTRYLTQISKYLRRGTKSLTRRMFDDLEESALISRKISKLFIEYLYQGGEASQRDTFI